MGQILYTEQYASTGPLADSVFPYIDLLPGAPPYFWGYSDGGTQHNTIWGNYTYSAGTQGDVAFWIEDEALLPYITTFYSGGARLTGAFPSLVGLTQLKNLYLNNSYLGGAFPSISSLTNLETISIGNGHFTGSFPDISSMSNITTIIANGNRFTNWTSTSIPSTLTYLDLSGNMLDSSSISLILNQLDTAGATNGTVRLHGGSNADASVIVKDNLKSKGWTVSTNHDARGFLYVESNSSLSIDTDALPGHLPYYHKVTWNTQSYPGPQYFTVNVSTLPTQMNGLWIEPDVPSNFHTNLTLLDLSSNLYGKFPDLTPYSALTSISFFGTGFSGDISSIMWNTNLNFVYLPSGDWFGGLGNTLDNHTNLVTFYVNGGRVGGVLPTLNNNTVLTSFTINGCDSGTIGPLSNKPNLNDYSASSCNLTGTIPSLAGASSLKTLGLAQNPGITGGIPDISGTQLITLNLSFTGVTSWNSSSTGNLKHIRLQGTHLDQGSVNDLFTQADAGGITNGTLYLSKGTSPPPSTPAAIAAKASLESKGWTVHVNTAPLFIDSNGIILSDTSSVSGNGGKIINSYGGIFGQSVIEGRECVNDMPKITLDSLNNSYGAVDTINDNFDKIENALNCEVMYRDNPVSTYSTMVTDLDMNHRRIRNLPDGVDPQEPVTLAQVTTALGSGASILSSFESQFGNQVVNNINTLASISYSVGENELTVYKNGVKMVLNRHYEEDTSNTVKWLITPSFGDILDFYVSKVNF